MIERRKKEDVSKERHIAKGVQKREEPKKGGRRGSILPYPERDLTKSVEWKSQTKKEFTLVQLPRAVGRGRDAGGGSSDYMNSRWGVRYGQGEGSGKRGKKPCCP